MKQTYTQPQSEVMTFASERLMDWATGSDGTPTTPLNPAQGRKEMPARILYI